MAVAVWNTQFDHALLRSAASALARLENAALRQRRFAEADEIRQRLWARSIIVEDTPQGVRWHRAVGAVRLAQPLASPRYRPPPVTADRSGRGAMWQAAARSASM